MTIELVIDNKIYSGWKKARVSRGLDRAAGDFDFTASEAWPNLEDQFRIRPGQSCEVRVEGETVITGNVDDVQISYRSDSHDLTIRGRSLTADLIDCSAANKTGQWKSVKLEKIANDLALPHGINVIAETDTGPVFDDFQIQQGETIFDAIERMCRLRAVMATDDRKGNLIIARAGTETTSTPLVSGTEDGNIMVGQARFTDRERFSRYICKGQTTGTDDYSADDLSVQAEAVDDNLTRSRTLMVIAEGKADAARCRDRARWEASTRAGRSVQANYTVQGWAQSDGSLWTPNTRVLVEDNICHIRETMLITSVTNQIDDAGSTTGITVSRPEAFELLAGLPKESKSIGYWVDQDKNGKSK
jgi:prophage tail gpP-like protein